jgi:hypothetical protein
MRILYIPPSERSLLKRGDLINYTVQVCGTFSSILNQLLEDFPDNKCYNVYEAYESKLNDLKSELNSKFLLTKKSKKVFEEIIFNLRSNEVKEFQRNVRKLEKSMLKRI